MIRIIKWIGIGILVIVFVWGLGTNILSDLEAQVTDDLTREQQIELMNKCFQDAKTVKGSGGYRPVVEGQIAAAFFEYRTKGR